MVFAAAAKIVPSTKTHFVLERQHKIGGSRLRFQWRCFPGLHSARIIRATMRIAREFAGMTAALPDFPHGIAPAF